MHATSIVAALLPLASTLAPASVELDPERELASLCPERTVLYVEGPGLAELFARGLEHPFLAALLGSRLGRTLQEQAPLTPQAALAVAAGWIERPLLPTLSVLASRGAALAIEVGVEADEEPSWILLAHGDDAGLLRGTWSSLLGSIADHHGVPRESVRNPRGTSRGVEHWALGEEVFLGLRQALLLASNDRELFERTIELGADPAARGLGGNDAFARDRSRRDDARGLLWSWVDLDALAGARPAAREKLASLWSNAGVQFLLGPAVAALGAAERASLELRLEEDQLTLCATAEGVEGPASAVLFAAPAGGAGSRAALPGRPGGSGALLYRDLAGIFARRAELFPVETLPRFSEAISHLAFLFGGEDVSQEILPALSPWLELVIDEAEFRPGTRPAVALPAAALCVELREAERNGERLVAAFQSLIGFLNIDRAQKAGAPMMLDVELQEGIKISSARFLTPAAGEGVDLHYNLEPACAVVGGRFVLGTHVSLVRSLCAGLARRTEPPAGTVPAGERLALSGSIVARALRDNREALVMNAVLEEGKPVERARAEIGGLEQLADLIESLEYSSERTADGGLRLRLGARLSREDGR